MTQPDESIPAGAKMNQQTMVKAAQLPVLVRANLALIDRDKDVGRTARNLYHLLFSIAGSSKQHFAGPSVFGKLLNVERQAVHRAVKELVDSGLMVVHSPHTVSVLVPEMFLQETLIVFGLVNRDNVSNDVAIGLTTQQVAAVAQSIPCPAPTSTKVTVTGAPKRGPGRPKTPKPEAPAPAPVAAATTPAPVQPPAMPAMQAPVIPPPPVMPQVQPPPVQPVVAQSAPPSQVVAQSAQPAPAVAPVEYDAPSVKMTPEIAQKTCENLEMMQRYLMYGPAGIVSNDDSKLKPTPMNWRVHTVNGTANVEAFTTQHFMGFFWYRVSRYRASKGLPLTLPGKDFGRVGRAISNLVIKVGGKVALFNFIDLLTGLFDLVQVQIGGQYGMSLGLDETALENPRIVTAVIAIQQMDEQTRQQLLEGIYQQQQS